MGRLSTTECTYLPTSQPMAMMHGTSRADKRGSRDVGKRVPGRIRPLLAAESTTADQGGLSASCSSPLSTTARRTAYFSPQRQSTPGLGYPGRPVSVPTPRRVRLRL